MSLDTAIRTTLPGVTPAANPTPAIEPTDYVAYVGIDWADRQHDIALYDCATDTWEDSVIQSRPQDILDWVTQLRQRYGHGKIAVALEQKRGPLLYALCQ